MTAADELAFPNYDGHGISKSWGNVLANANVGLPFIDMHGSGGSGSTLKPASHARIRSWVQASGDN